jgi:hypothetical protein
MTTDSKPAYDAQHTLKVYFRHLSCLFLLAAACLPRAQVFGLNDPELAGEEKLWIVVDWIVSNVTVLLLLWFFTVRRRGIKVVAVLTVLYLLLFMWHLVAAGMWFDSMNYYDWSRLLFDGMSAICLGVMWYACTDYRARLKATTA